MKRLLVVATSVLCLVAFFFACSDLQNLSEPKKVVVKPGDAKYSIPFGGYSVAFNDYINVTKLQENLSGSDDEDSGDTKLQLSVYDYQDPMEKSVQKYIIEYPIASISLNPDDYLGDMLGFLDGFNGTSGSDNDDKFNIPVEIPEDLKKIEIKQDIDLPDLNAEIVGKIGEFDIEDTQTKFLVPEQNLDSTELERVPGYVSNIDIKIPLELATVTFSSGSLDITISTTDPSFGSDYAFNLTAELCDTNGNGIYNDRGYPASATVTFDQNHKNETLELPIDNRELPQNMKIHLIGRVEGNSAIVHTYSVNSVGFTTDNLKVKKVTGLNIDAITKEIDQLLGDGDSPIGSDLLRTATVEEGNITLSSELPSGWSGVTAETDFAVSGAIDDVKFVNASKKDDYLFYREANLSGKRIDGTKSLSAKLDNLTLSFNNATIVLEDEQPAVSVECKANITKLSDVKVNLEKLLGDETLTSSIEQEIGSNITDYVVSATVDELNLQADIDTNLAIKALWVKPTIQSRALKIDDALEYTNVIDGDPIQVSYGKENGWEGFELTKLQGDKVDFEITLDVHGDKHDQNSYDKSDDTLTLTSLDLTRDDYYLKVAFGAPKDKHIFECKQLVLKIDDGIIPEGPIETGLSIGDMFDNLVEDKDSEQGKLIDKLINAIELQGIEGYLYVTAPKVEGENPLKSLPPITGNVTALYKTNGVDKDPPVVLFETADTEKGLIKYDVPSFASLADKNSLITDNTMFTKYYSARTTKDENGEDNLCKIINDKANDLKFDYDISFGGGEGNTITLNREQINALQDAANAAAGGSATANAEIAMTIAVVLPLKLNITKDIEIENVMTLAGDSDEDIDLLGGDDSDTDFSEYTDYIKALKSLTLIYGLENSFGLNVEAKLSEKNGVIGAKVMNFNKKRDTITITTDEVDKILTANSFIPQIFMTLKAGTISVKRNAELKMNTALVIKTDNDAGIEFEL